MPHKLRHSEKRPEAAEKREARRTLKSGLGRFKEMASDLYDNWMFHRHMSGAQPIITREKVIGGAILIVGLSVLAYKQLSSDSETNPDQRPQLPDHSSRETPKPSSSAPHLGEFIIPTVPETGCILCSETRERAVELLEKNDPEGERILLDILESLEGGGFGGSFSYIIYPIPPGYGINRISLTNNCVLDVSDTRGPIHRFQKDIFTMIEILGEHGIRGNETVDNILLSGINSGSPPSWPEGDVWVRFNSALSLYKYGSRKAKREATKRLHEKVDCRDGCPYSVEVDTINLAMLQSRNPFNALKRLALDPKVDPEVKEIAIEYLGITAKETMKPKKAARELARLVDCRDKDVRLAAMRALGYHFGENAIEPILKRMNDANEHEDVRIKAAYHLAQLRDERGREFVSDGLEKGAFEDPKKAEDILKTIDNYLVYY